MPRRRSRRRRDPTPGWLWLLAGLAIGAAVAVGLYRVGDDVRRDGRAGAPSAGAPGGGAPVAAAPVPSAPAAADAAPAPAASPPAVAEPSPSRFEFYDILPQFEVVIPEIESAPRRDREPVSVAAPGSYVLQAGSFRSHGDADRLQASLALLGIESRIQTVTIDQDVFHRVRIGPMSDLDELNRIRRQLQDARVEALLMRVAD